MAMDRRGMLGLAVMLPLAGCGTARVPRPAVPQPGPDLDMSCVPYVRMRTGISLRGDAREWWAAAAGRYARTRRPEPGGVLVLAGSRRLPSGHVAVVSRVVSAREIRVDHANWASGAARGRIALDQPVQDASPGNDWSLVRVWYPRVNYFGTTLFPAHGFILPRHELAAR
jgi:hypothetical protein